MVHQGLHLNLNASTGELRLAEVRNCAQLLSSLPSCALQQRPPKLNTWFQLPSSQAFTKSCTALSRALLIVARVDLAVSLYPGVIAAPLVLGTVAGCGGRLVGARLEFGPDQCAL